MTKGSLCVQVIMRNLSSEELSVFTYQDWLSRTRGPKRTLVCEMAAVVDEEVMVELTTYTIQVKTSDNAGRPDRGWICATTLRRLVTLGVDPVHARRGSSL